MKQSYLLSVDLNYKNKIRKNRLIKLNKLQIKKTQKIIGLTNLLLKTLTIIFIMLTQILIGLWIPINEKGHC